MSEVRVCSNPSCGKKEEKKGEFKTCSRCKKAIYCSKECQVAHWKNGHKQVCKPANTTSAEVKTETIAKKELSEEESKEVARIEEDLRQTYRSYSQVSNELAVNQTEKKGLAVMNKLLNEIDDNQNSYYLYGKCFMNLPKNTIQGLLDDKVNYTTDQINKLTKTQDLLAKKQIELENNLRDTLQQ